ASAPPASSATKTESIAAESRTDFTNSASWRYPNVLSRTNSVGLIRASFPFTLGLFLAGRYSLRARRLTRRVGREPANAANVPHQAAKCFDGRERQEADRVVAFQDRRLWRIYPCKNHIMWPQLSQTRQTAVRFAQSRPKNVARAVLS